MRDVRIFLLLLAVAAAFHAQAQYQPVPLDKAINSPSKDLLPRISPDGKSLYFVRMGHPQNFTQKADDQDIWVAERDAPDKPWRPATLLPFPVNNVRPNAVFGLTPDGNTLVLLNAYERDPARNRGLAFAHRKGPKEWSEPFTPAFEPFERKSANTSFFLANDGRTLLMEFEGEDTNGFQDLYVSFLQDNGVWSKPLNLGSVINTMEYETSPFLASDMRTLYFGSSGHEGQGSVDIFVSTRLDDTWQNWSAPRNLGPPINTPNFDAYFSIAAAGDSAYYGTTVGPVNVDIYRVAMPPDLRPKPVQLVSGKVSDSETGKPVMASIRYTDLKTGILLGVARTEPTTGSYQITLPAGSDYDLHARADGFLGSHERIDLTKDEQHRSVALNLKLLRLSSGKSLRLNNLFFDLGSNQLQPESKAELTALLDALKKNPKLRVELAGHTDSTGGAERNLKLSQERAANVRKWLVEHGVSPDRMEAKGYADSKPVAPNSAPEGRALNRRVECVILSVD